MRLQGWKRAVVVGLRWVGGVTLAVGLPLGSMVVARRLLPPARTSDLLLHWMLINVAATTAVVFVIEEAAHRWAIRRWRQEKSKARGSSGPGCPRRNRPDHSPKD